MVRRPLRSTSSLATTVTIDRVFGSVIGIGAVALGGLASSFKGCTPAGPPSAVLVAGGGVTISRAGACAGGAAVEATDTFVPAATTVLWTSWFSVTRASSVCTAPLCFSLQLAAGGAPVGFWTTWTRGCVWNGHPMCIGTGDWADPFAAVQLPASTTTYRLRNMDYGSIYSSIASRVEDSFTLPLASIQRRADDAGFTIALSPDDATRCYS